MELRYNLEGHQLGIVSVDINYLGTSMYLVSVSVLYNILSILYIY